MKQIISYATYLVERERLKRERPKHVELNPPGRVDEEEAQCLYCDAPLVDSETFQRYRVCDSCRFHHSLSAWDRIYLLADPESFELLYQSPAAFSPSYFSDNAPYMERIQEAQERTGLSEAVVTGTCTIGGNPVILAVLDFAFLGGNMGMVVGDRIARAFTEAKKKRLPVVTIVSSGGARIEEGVISLIQMAKTVTAVRQLQQAGLPYISVLTHPTTGEVYASFANLGDIIIAEPGAMIGFAPLRVTEDTSFAKAEHTAESHLIHGLIDQVVDRTQLRQLISVILDLLSSRYLLEMHRKGKPYFAHPHPQEQAWQTIQIARHEERPTALDHISNITSRFVELHGDRSYKDDPAIVCGLAELGGQAVMIIGQERKCNGGQISPEGLRKAQRAMIIAAKFGMPLINLIDTPGASPGPESEERGIGNAIASTMALLADLPTPVISAIIGQGGSEGALALGIADSVLMMENAFFSVIPPERAASIMYRDAGKADELATALKLTAADCEEYGIVDVVVPEPDGGAHTNHLEASRLLRNLLIQELLKIQTQPPSKLVKSRYKRFRFIGGRKPFLGGRLLKQADQIQNLVQGGVSNVKQRLGGSYDKSEHGVETETGTPLTEIPESLPNDPT